MSCQVIQTDRAPAAIGPYSQAVKVGCWLYVSGQLGLQPESGDLVSEDFAAQAKQALGNLQNILQAAGYAMQDVVSVDVFLTDMSRFAQFNGMYQEAFGEHKPARAVVEVKGLPKGGLVELKCVAHKE